MSNYRYILEKGSKKYYCPDCNQRRWVRYIDTETGDYLPEQYGRCDRESKCTYHLNPYLDGYAKTISEQGNCMERSNNWKPQRKTHEPAPEPVYFDLETFNQTLQPERYIKNTFIQNLFSRVPFPFEVDRVTKIIQLYRLGSVAHGYRSGAITFPFIDIQGNVRAVQVKQFDEANHTTGTDFLHSIIEKHYTRSNTPLPKWLTAYTQQDKRVSCLFGEHLLSRYPSNPVALVEAPKTAIYGALYFGLPEDPENLIWLAVYNNSSFSIDKVKALRSRDVFVFPDLSKDGNTFKEWQTKAKDFENRLPGTRFVFSDLLEQLAPERDKSKGNDLADYLIKQNWRNFKRRTIQQPTKDEVQIFTHLEPLPKVQGSNIEQIEPQEKEQPENWMQDILQLEKYFQSISVPAKPIRLNQCTTITDIPKFIESHFAIVKWNKGKQTYTPYLNRLKELKTMLETFTHE